ncbi:MAG: SH3 domain-containing protein, partial [Chloroflexota bacterium]
MGYRLSFRVFFTVFAAIVGVVAPVTVSAQDPAVCPADALLSFVRAAAACREMSPDMVCIGNGAVALTASDGDTQDAPGLTLPAADTQMVTVSTPTLDGPTYAAARLLLDERFGADARQIEMWLIGTATLDNHVPPLAFNEMTATGVLNIRTAPRPDADIVTQLDVRQGVEAIGRTASSDWFWARVPITGEIGWASAGSLTWQTNPSFLEVVDETAVYRHPFQVLSLVSAPPNADICGAATDSGLIVQSPGAEAEITLTLNEMGLRVAGTALFQASGDGLAISSLSGWVALTDGRFVPAGATLNTATDDRATALDSVTLGALPLNSLGRRVTLPAPLSDTGIQAAAAAYTAPEPTPIPDQTPSPEEVCTQITRRDVDLKAGPGDYFETINTLTAGSAVNPVLQTQNADGETWYQLDNSN